MDSSRRGAAPGDTPKDPEALQHLTTPASAASAVVPKRVERDVVPVGAADTTEGQGETAADSEDEMCATSATLKRPLDDSGELDGASSTNSQEPPAKAPQGRRLSIKPKPKVPTDRMLADKAKENSGGKQDANDLVAGETPTKRALGLEKAQGRRNHIDKVYCNGTLASDKETIERAFFAYYQSLFAVRKANVALGLPIRTSTAKFFALGLNNTLEEMVEAHLTAQYERLSRTPAGRYTLAEAGIRFAPALSPKINISSGQRAHLKILPIPRNMNPTYHTERRIERAKALHSRFETNTKTAYVDAAELNGHQGFSVAVSRGCRPTLIAAQTDVPLTCRSIPTATKQRKRAVTSLYPYLDHGGQPEPASSASKSAVASNLAQTRLLGFRLCSVFPSLAGVIKQRRLRFRPPQ
ncbi:hypothetical protein HPB52_001711 [Rhipicephalus sanguineus]|uniref:Uncharacterized protein n=1 Tax=Rhipicephalus sanguineus TaxID=34632 RepID=A0A9D4SXE3_RHISA|nr:hypothetical protein HPB52_001711 [Rhipicephalus sanguineus]